MCQREVSENLGDVALGVRIFPNFFCITEWVLEPLMGNKVQEGEMILNSDREIFLSGVISIIGTIINEVQVKLIMLHII